DEVRRTALELFRKRILDDEKLKLPTDDAYLIQFLRARKYDVDKAMELIRNYFYLITSHPEFYDKLDKEKMYKFARPDFINILPFRHKDGCLLVNVKIKHWDPEEVSVQVLFCTAAAIIFSLENFPANQICGVRVIYDCENHSLKQISYIVPRYLSLLAKALRNSLPIRFKSIHVVNEPNTVRYTWKLFRPLLSEKIKNRIFFHGDNKEELHKYIPKELLPQEYGGDCTSYNNRDCITKGIDKIYDKFSMVIRTLFA
ncbi:alpha-tocopherol transfer protein-like, partial [Trichonephila clavata]